MSKLTWKDIVGWAWGLGYRIAAPIVIFALIGRWIDRAIKTKFIFLLLGIFLAIATSGYLVWKQVKEIIASQTDDRNPS